jgi:hypothetical protein
MMRRPVSRNEQDPRFKTPAPDWDGGKLITWTGPGALNMPPAVGMWDPTLQKPTYPHLVALAKRKPSSVIYKPLGVPGTR